MSDKLFHMITVMRPLADWKTMFPILALIAFLLGAGRELSIIAVGVIAFLLIGAVLASVHHAEVVAHKVGEPFGSLVLAIAVTVIEVALIVSVMTGGDPDKVATLARDTVFAAVMITVNGIVGLCLLTSALRGGIAVFSSEGSSSALATVATLTTCSLVLPAFTIARSGSQFSGPQLAFAAVASLSLYLLFLAVQTVRHRDYFLPVDRTGRIVETKDHADPPTSGQMLVSLALLLVALIAVVGDAKTVSPTLEYGVASAGLPHSVVGVIIAMLVLAPETLAAARSARRGRTQTSLNLAYGSAMASIGLTIPVIGIVTIWLPGPLILGLDPTHMILFLLSIVVGMFTLFTGRATILHGGLHLAIFSAFLFLAVSP